MLLQGTQLGPYEIISSIDAPEMGEVYKARDARSGRIVLIKTVPADIVNHAEAREQFQREAETITAISSLCDFVNKGQTSYVVLEYMDAEAKAPRLPKDTIALAVRLGLKPYSEFEGAMESVWPKRVAPEQRKEILEKIYPLVAQKVIKERDKKCIADVSECLSRHHDEYHRAGTQVEKALTHLWSAIDSFHEGPPKWFDLKPIIGQLLEYSMEFIKTEASLSMATEQLTNPKGKTINTGINVSDSIITRIGMPLAGITQPVGPTSNTPHRWVFPGKKASAIDHPFIKALHACMPSPPPGKRSRFDRIGLIEKVFEWMGDRTTRSRITAALTRKK